MYPLLKYLFTKQSGGVRLVRSTVAAGAVITALGRLPQDGAEYVAVAMALLAGLISAPMQEEE